MRIVSMAERRQKRDRRQSNDRRRQDRRRKNDSRVFVIELTSSEMRIAYLERSAVPGGVDQVSAWKSRWRKNAPALETPEGLDELTAALRDAARRHNMFTADVRVVLNGKFCVTRTVRGSVDAVRSELQRLEQRSRLYLSLGPGEKVLVSRMRLLDARHAHALAAACNKATLETVQNAAENAGIELSVVEPALSALNRAASRLPDRPEEPFLLVHFAETTTEIGVCHEGRLLLDYRPGGATSMSELSALLQSHLNRLNRHAARYVRSASPPNIKHVFLCGDDAAAKAASLHFGRTSPMCVRVIEPGDIQSTWTLNEAAASEATAAALGGLLLSYLPADESDAPNFMQHILECRREPLRPTLLRSLAPLAATLLIAASLSIYNARQRSGLESMQTELDGLAVSAAKATELRLKLSASEAKLAQLRQLAAKLPAELGDGAIRRLGACMPSDVWLNQLRVTDQARATLSGASYLEGGVYEFVRWLELAPGFEEIALKRTNASSSAAGPATSFELELTLGDFDDQATRVARHD
jgi:hypothetical protein